MEQQHCQNCNQKNDCQEIYNQLCNAKGKPVLRQATEVFLLPLVLFIVVIAVIDKLLSGCTTNEPLRMTAVIAPAVIVIAVYTAVLKKWRYKN